MTIAKETILLMWNKEFTPKFETWLKEFSNVYIWKRIDTRWQVNQRDLYRFGSPSLNIEGDQI